MLFYLGIASALLVTMIVGITVVLPWLRALSLGVAVSPLWIVAIRARGNPPNLLIDAYRQLMDAGVECTLAMVEWEFIQQRDRVANLRDLVRVVQDAVDDRSNVNESKDSQRDPPPVRSRVPGDTSRSLEQNLDVEVDNRERARKLEEYLDRVLDLSCRDQDPGNYEKALEVCHQAIEFAPNSVKPYLARSSVYESLDRRNEALADCSSAIEIDPNCAGAYRARARAHWFVDDLESARADHDRSVELSPDDPVGYSDRASFLEGLERWEDALADYDRALQLEPEDADVLFSRGLVHVALDQTNAAVTDFRGCIDRDPNSPVALKCRSEAYIELGQYEEAIKDLSRAIKLDKQFSDAYKTRAQAYRMNGDLRRADRDQKRAQKLASKD